MRRNRNGGGDTTKIDKSNIETDVVLLRRKKLNPAELAEIVKRGKLQQKWRAADKNPTLTKEGKQVEADAASRELGYKYQSANVQDIVNKRQQASNKGKSANSIYVKPKKK